MLETVPLSALCSVLIPSGYIIDMVHRLFSEVYSEWDGIDILAISNHRFSNRPIFGDVLEHQKNLQPLFTFDNF